MPGRPHENQLAVLYISMDIFADLVRRDDVIAALKYERAGHNPAKIRAIIGREGDPGECFCNLGIGSAEAVGQLDTQFWAIHISHDGRRHSGGPPPVIVRKKLQKLVDLRSGETANVVVIIDITRRWADQDQALE